MDTEIVQQRLLNEVESRELLKQYGIEQNECEFANNKSETLEIAQRMGFPLVLKVVSDKIVHKSDFGGVKVGLQNIEEVSEAYDQIMENSNKHDVSAEDIDGVTVQEMVTGLEELLIGAKRDLIFGTIIVVGLGGVWVELMKDVALGIAPLSESDIIRMLNKLKGYPLLDGYRGSEKADIPAFIAMIQKIESMVVKEKDILELDLNPVIIKKRGSGCATVDARIVMREQ